MRLIVRAGSLASLVFFLLFLFQNCARTSTPMSEITGTITESSLTNSNIENTSDKDEVLLSAAAVSTSPTAQAWTGDGCNTTSFFQDPTDPTLFWGRKLKYSGLTGETPTGECTWKTWGVALYRADFTKRTMKFIKYAFKPNIAIQNGRTVTTAYDPTVAILNGVKYAAFECHGTGFPGSVGACIGKVDSNNNIIPSTTRVYVDGVSSTNSTVFASASVPKLTVSLAGKAYLSWTQVLIRKSDKAWLKLSSRTMPFNPAMAMVASDHSGAWNSYNPKTVPGVADLFDVKQIASGRFLFTGARGENGCLRPLDKVEGCYRLEVGSINNIEAHGVFDKYSQSVYSWPDNPQEYFRWAYDPVQKTWGVLGSFLRKQGTTTGLTVNPGIYFIPIASSGTSLPVRNTFICDPATQPSPHWGIKSGKCYRSCGALGGTRGFTTTCASNGMIDAGIAYDVPYCCK